MRRKGIISITAYITVALLAFSVLSGCKEQAPSVSGKLTEREYKGEPHTVSLAFESPEAMLSGMKMASENEKFALYINEQSLHFALYSKQDGEIFLSNPYNAQNDPYYSGNIQNDLDSILMLEYLDIKESNKYNLWSSADCVALGQYSVTLTEQGARIQMTLGEIKSERLTPTAMEAERFEDFLSKMSDRNARRMKLFYQKYSLLELSGDTQAVMLKQYPMLKDNDLYILGKVSDSEIRFIEEALKEAEYTNEDLAADREAMGTGEVAESFPSFTADIELILSDRGLTVKMPAESFTFDASSYTLLSASFAPYFGADSPSEEGGGYLFIPDGSGAIIAFDESDENRRRLISAPVYNRDFEIQQSVDDREGEPYYLPVFGIRRNSGSALFAVIGEGEENAVINARLGSPNSSYFTVYPTVKFTTNEFLTFNTKISSKGSSVSAYVTDSNRFTGDFSVTYTPLSGDDANYSGMARYYRSVLRENGMKTKKDPPPVSLGLEIIGASYTDATVFGLNTRRQTAYTTFAQAAEMGDYFLNGGISGIEILYKGWQNRGLNAGLADLGKASGTLGGASGLKRLIQWAEKSGTGLFAESDIQFVRDEYLFDGFSAASDSAKQLDGEFAGLRDFEPDKSQFGDLRFALLPERYSGSMSKLIKRTGKLGLPGLSLADLGTYLPSGNKKANRSQTKAAAITAMKSAGDTRLAFTGANAFVLPYADGAWDLPLSFSAFTGETHAVPFLQMVLSGSVSYYSQPVNLNDDWEDTMLRCAESGTYPSFLLAADNISALKHSDFTMYFALDFETLKEEVLSSYKSFREKLEAVDSKEIKAHRYITSNVTCTEYENGSRVFVNYGQAEYTAENITIPARDFLVISDIIKVKKER